MKTYQNFDQFVIDYWRHGWIIVDGDELKMPSQTLDDAWEWLSARYKASDGGECLDFVLDEILEECTNKYRAKLFVTALHSDDAVTRNEAMRLIRHDYCAQKIEHFKAQLVRLAKEGPDPMDIRKQRLEEPRNAA